jgi:hypothetical protein
MPSARATALPRFKFFLNLKRFLYGSVPRACRVGPLAVASSNRRLRRDFITLATATALHLSSKEKDETERNGDKTHEKRDLHCNKHEADISYAALTPQLASNV